jgi:hypothetical protein
MDSQQLFRDLGGHFISGWLALRHGPPFDAWRESRPVRKRTSGPLDLALLPRSTFHTPAPRE